MAYRLLSRNQPLSQHLALALQGTLFFFKVTIWFYFTLWVTTLSFVLNIFLLSVFYYKLYFFLLALKRILI